MEGWLSGRKHWFAKSAQFEKTAVGSTPTSSAILTRINNDNI